MSKAGGLAEYVGFVAAGLAGALAGNLSEGQPLLETLPISLTLGAVAGLLVALLIRAASRRRR
jgi:hypothetical protein